MVHTQMRGLGAALAATVLVAACQAATATPSLAPTATATPTAAPTASPSPTTEPTAAATFPPTRLSAGLDIAYDSTGAPFDASKLGGIIQAQVVAYWYTSGPAYVTVYVTFVDLSQIGPLCPGNSIQTANGFEFVSNAPTTPGACTGEEATLALPPVGVRFCTSLAAGSFAYVTAIPVGAEGVLYASIEKPQADGSIVGVTGRAATSTGEAPEVDLDVLGCSPVPGV